MQCKELIWQDTAAFMDAFTAKAERLRIPLSGSIELTRRCNLNCVHCYLGPQDKRRSLQSLEMSTSRICSLLDEITDAGCLNLLITGGEPLLRDDFQHIYRHAKENGLLVTVFTNGTMITNNIVDLFCGLPPIEVEISLYGATPTTYERITRVPGSYEKCLQGMQSLLQNGVRVNLKTILMTMNSNELSEMEEFAKGLGVRFRFDAAISPCLDGNNEPLRLRVSPEEAIEKEMADPETVRKWGEFYEKFKGCSLGTRLYECNAGITAFHIDPFGGLMPCIMTTDLRYDLSGAAFMKGWEETMPLIRERESTGDFACRGCEKINLCGYCPPFFRLETGAEDAHSEYLCRMGDLRLQYIHNHFEKGENSGQLQGLR
jgi:radical SAM protein with 4Fe4S-binding SPASM domain